MTELIPTEAERLRMHEDQRIASEYRALRELHPNVAAFRIVRSLAESGNFRSKSVAGIRSALIRTGCYTPNRKNA